MSFFSKIPRCLNNLFFQVIFLNLIFMCHAKLHCKTHTKYNIHRKHNFKYTTQKRNNFWVRIVVWMLTTSWIENFWQIIWRLVCFTFLCNFSAIRIGILVVKNTSSAVWGIDCYSHVPVETQLSSCVWVTDVMQKLFLWCPWIQCGEL